MAEEIKKTNYKMVTCDLDGTLFGSDLKISKENDMAIAEFYKKGIPFVPCTGRALSEIPHIVESPHIRYIIYSGGAGILDKKSGEHIQNVFPQEVKEKLAKILSLYDHYTFIHANGECFADSSAKGKEKEYNIDEALYETVDNVAISLNNFNREFLLKEVGNMCIFFKDQDDLSKCREELIADGRILVTEPWAFNLEIYYIKAGKGKAIECLAEKLGIDVSEVISVGDSSNDITALQTAGLGICVSDGNDELKKVADVIACSSKEHVADYVLKKYFN